MARWVTEKLTYNQDRDILQVVTVYEDGINKEYIKNKYEKDSYKRYQLVKDCKSPFYNYKRSKCNRK